MDTIHPDLIRQLLAENDEGDGLIWLERPGEKTFNKMYAGKPALTALSQTGYLRGTIKGGHYRAHRVLWVLRNGCWPEGEIDHIDGNKTNNKAGNLRDVPKCQNQRNRKMDCQNTSGKMGVWYRKSINRWIARITVNNKKIWLGQFTTMEAAIQAREKAEKLHGFHENHGRG
jgi:hypothetical protein